LYRLGSISIEEIEAVIGVLKNTNTQRRSTIAPGMLSKHYAPQTKTILSEAITQDLILFDKKRVRPYQTFFENENIVAHEVLSTGNLTEAASQLYNALHKLDQLHLDVIIAERFPDYGLGRTINDRLERATTK
jgi:L-threonylcarbamoyladenylate synthase